MNIKIRAYGVIADITGAEEFDIAESGDSETLYSQVLKKFPLLKEHYFVMAVNDKITKGKETIREGDTVALLPPFSGG